MFKMIKYDIVVIGGGPAGVTSVISAHNTYKDKKIVGEVMIQNIEKEMKKKIK